MNPVRFFAVLSLLTAACNLMILNARAQTSAFTYQGRLSTAGAPAGGSYDLSFGLFDAATNGSAAGATLTNTAVAVNSGLFTVVLDFGAGAFPGANRWLEIGVRTNGSTGNFAILSPRQPVTSAPYAVQAWQAANATSVTAGAVTAAGLAAGAAAANLTNSGQSGVASGGVVLSATDEDTALLNAGYVKIGTTLLTENWVQHTNGTSPAARGAHTAIWTGSEMIIWGGTGNGNAAYNDGGRFNPALNTWTALSTSGAPSARYSHTAVWTGTEMIVWGGVDAGLNYLNTGGRYNPALDSWATVSTSGAPGNRAYHTAVWTGSEMIIWGGLNGNGTYLDGSRYSPTLNTWTAVNPSGPNARAYHTAVWTGTDMIVWGGANANSFMSNGYRYNRAADTWMLINSTGGPTARGNHSVVWTGTEMIVWGGKTNLVTSPSLNDGGRFNPITGGWTAVTTNNAPGGRNGQTAVWTGSEMIVWGGINQTTVLNTGGRYNTATGTWTTLTATSAPNKRYFHSAVWTGAEMLVWGGFDGGSYNNENWAYTPGKVMYLFQKP